MDGVAQLSETQLVEKIRQIRSEAELNHLIEETQHRFSDASIDGWYSFSSAVIRLINAVNPLYIEDPAEWDMLKRARVLIHRQSSHMLAS
jgi:hypothetical protein